MRLCELREKEVINMCSCKRLGRVEDLVFDCERGEVEAFIVPEQGRLAGLFVGTVEYVIPFECVKRIGTDIIMVEISEEKCRKGCKL